MRLMRLLLLLAAAALMCGCATDAPHTSEPSEIALLPDTGGRLLVLAEVDGAGPYPFVLDTGASVSILDLKLIDELGLAPKGFDVTVQGVTGAATAPAYEPVVFGLGGERIAPTWVVALALPDAAPARGVLGVDVLAQRVIQIDMRSAVVRLGSARYVPPVGALASRSTLTLDVHGLPHVGIRVNQEAGLALVDTGMAGMIVDPDLAARARVPVIDAAPARFKNPSEIVDVVNVKTPTPHSGRARLGIGRARWSVAHIALVRPAVLDRLDAGAPTEAILGATVFADTILVLDFTRRDLFIVQRRT